LLKYVFFPILSLQIHTIFTSNMLLYFSCNPNIVLFHWNGLHFVFSTK